MDCKWSKLNASGNGNSLFHQVLGLEDFPLLALWGNKKWLPSMKAKKLGKNSEQNVLKGVQMVQFECPWH